MKKIISFTIASMPLSVLAQTTGALSTINNFSDLKIKLLSIGNTITYMLVAAGIIFIVFNVVWYIIKPSSSEERTAAGLNILWGIVGLFIIVSIWGLVNILTNTFATNNTVPTDRFPKINYDNTSNGSK